MLVIYRQMHWIEQSIKNVIDDADNDALSYVTQNDVKNCFHDSQVLVLEAPLGANLSVGQLDEVSSPVFECYGSYS